MTRSTILMAAVSLALLVPLSAEAGGGKGRQKSPARPSSASGEGQTAFVEPGTGDLRPEAPPDRARPPAVSAARVDGAGHDLPEIPLKGRRGYKVDLKGRYQSAAVLTLKPDGSTSMSCVDGDLVDIGGHAHAR